MRKTRFKSQWPGALLLLLLVISLEVSASDCNELLKTVLSRIDPRAARVVNINEHVNHRNFLIEIAKRKKIPVFLKKNNLGEDIPVLQITANTARNLEGFFQNSFGTQIVLQIDWTNDHGLLRAGKYIIDVDEPGKRGFGEIQKTGLAWKNIDGYLPRRATYAADPILEVAYILTPEEKSIIDYYQKLRRAAVFRVKFEFDGNWSAPHPKLLKRGGENCFLFCKALEVDTHYKEIMTRLKRLGVQNPEAFLESPDGLKAFTAIRSYVNDIGVDKLNPRILKRSKLFTLFEAAFPRKASKEEKQEILEWFVSLDATSRYGRVLKDLGVSEDIGIDDTVNSRASAILVYDESESPASFTNATYERHGKSIDWPSTPQSPVR